MIFNEQQDFHLTSTIASSIDRLNFRFNHFLLPIKDKFNNAKVLDLGSHNGRWTYASIKLGAKFVFGVEKDKSYIDKARESLSKLNINNYDFECCDVIDYKFEKRYDIVLCLGLVYYIFDYLFFLKKIRTICPKLLIIDASMIITVKNSNELENCIKKAGFMYYKIPIKNYKIPIKNKPPDDYLSEKRISYLCYPIWHY